MDYKKTFRYSTGNPIVDEVGTMNFTGNVIPMVWFKTIRYPNGAPNNNAIHILADIVYWYRPKEERDEESGQVICMKKKFRDDYLQRSYDQMADTFGLSKKQATEAVKALEKMGIIKRIFKTIQVRGQILNNVLFIELVPKRLYEVTFPEEIEENTLSPPKEIPLSVEGGRGIPEKREGTTSKVTGPSCIKKGINLLMVHGVNALFLFLCNLCRPVYHCLIFSRCASRLVLIKAVHFFCAACGIFVNFIIFYCVHLVNIPSLVPLWVIRGRFQFIVVHLLLCQRMGIKYLTPCA